jgi:hypothetical protein
MADDVPSSMAASGVTKRTEFTLMHIFSPLLSVNKPLNAFFDGGAALQITTIDIDIIAILSPKGGNCFGVPFSQRRRRTPWRYSDGCDLSALGFRAVGSLHYYVKLCLAALQAASGYHRLADRPARLALS